MSVPAPTDPTRRIGALDTLRGIALCGILFCNIVDMGGPIAMDRPMGSPAWADPDWQIWSVTQLLLTGTMRGLFSLLFGIGLLLFIGDDDSADRARLFVRRLVILALFGVVDATFLLWPGDILLVYALAGAIALILHLLKPRHMLGVVFVLIIFLSAWGAMTAPGITPADTVYSPEMLAREGAARLGGYWQSFDYMSWVSWSWTVNAITYRWVADALAFMLLGVALYRLRLFDPLFSEVMLRRICMIGYSLGGALRLIHIVAVMHNDGGPTMLSAAVEQPGRLAMMLGHLGLFLLLWRRAAWPALMHGFATMGRMPLTLYLGQSILAAVIFSGFGFGLWNSLSWPQLWLVVLGILMAEWAFAAIWFRFFRYGPFEWLWRWGTYLNRPPILARLQAD